MRCQNLDACDGGRLGQKRALRSARFSEPIWLHLRYNTVEENPNVHKNLGFVKSSGTAAYWALTLALFRGLRLAANVDDSQINLGQAYGFELHF
jgi:hypothetical protein